MNKLKINMHVAGLNVKGQGVGSAYLEQEKLVSSLPSLDVSVNKTHPAKFTINHFHTVNPSFYFKFSKKSINVVSVHFIPEYDDGSLKMPKWMFKIYRKYVLSFYHKADEVMVVNPYFIKELEKIQIPRERVTYIPNFVSDTKFHPLENIEELRSRYNLDPKRFTVLGVGQTQTRKGILDFGQIAKENPDIQFLWAGGFSFGHLTSGYQEIKDLMEHAPENLKFLGIVDREKMNEIYNLADVLFLPSYQELFPMTLLEAVNVGLPFLVRDLDLYKDIFLSPYLVGSNNEEFIEILNHLRDDRVFYEEAKKLSLEIKNYYSREHVAKLWDEYYHRLAQKYAAKIKKQE